MASTNGPSTPLEPVVKKLLQEYRSIEILHPLLQKLFESSAQKALFASIAQQDYDKLMARSQDLADHQINAYEKAFCLLMEKEDDRVGGLEIYVEKVLGIRSTSTKVVGCGTKEKSGDLHEDEELLVKAIAIRALLADGTFHNPCQAHLSPKPNPLFSVSITATKHQQKTDEHPPTMPSPILPPKVPTNTPTAIESATKSEIADPKLMKLYRTYQSALADFRSLSADPRTTISTVTTLSASSDTALTRRTKSAKFLRDTTENCLQYLMRARAKTPSGMAGEAAGEARMVTELTETLAVAKQVAEEGSGGRKRRFDVPGDGGQRGGKKVRGGWRGIGRAKFT